MTTPGSDVPPFTPRSEADQLSVANWSLHFLVKKHLIVIHHVFQQHVRPEETSQDFKVSFYNRNNPFFDGFDGLFNGKLTAN